MKTTVRRVLNALILLAMALGLIVALTTLATADVDERSDTKMYIEADAADASKNFESNLNAIPPFLKNASPMQTCFDIPSDPKPEAAWTIMVYLNGDNSLDASTDEAFNRMEVGACNPNVNVVVLWDRHPGNIWYSGTKHYEVKCDTDIEEMADYTEGVDVRDCGEVNLGDSQTLHNFVSWSQTKYPAEHYLLSVADHGGGWSPEFPTLLPFARGWMAGGTGLSWDDPGEPADFDYLSTSEVGNVLQWVPDSLDIVFYDACLMGMLEEVYEIKDHSSYFIASENIAWDIFCYDEYINPITANTQPVELAEHIVTVYSDFLHNEDYAGSLAAIDLSATDEVSRAVDNLAQVLITGQSNVTVREQIGKAYMVTQKLDYDGNGEIEQSTDGYVDLYDLAVRIREIVTSTSVVDAAQGVVDVLNTSGFILTETHHSGLMENLEGDVREWDLEDVHGVSIYMPFGEELYVGLGCNVPTLDHCVVNYDTDCIKVRDYYTTTVSQPLSFSQETAWGKFVNSFIDAYYCANSTTASGLHLQETEGEGLPPMRPTSVLMETREPNYDTDEWIPWRRPIGGVTIIDSAWRHGHSASDLVGLSTVYLPPILRDQ